MAFSRKTPTTRTRKFIFDPDTEYGGLEMVTYGVTVDEWIQVVSRPQMVDLFAERLIEWNWRQEAPDGSVADVPPTREGVGQLDASDAHTIANHWYTKVGSTGDPLERTRVTSSDLMSDDGSSGIETMVGDEDEEFDPTD